MKNILYLCNEKKVKNMRKIYISAGHRGAGTGAKGLIDEGTEVIELRNAIAKSVQSYKVEVIVDNDKDNLNTVVKKINATAKPTDISLDLHFNSFNTRALGSEVLTPNSPSSFEMELAEELVAECAGALHTKNRGVKRESAGQHPRLAMLSSVHAECILLEVCFCDNQEDVKKYIENKNKLISSISKILVKYANR